MTGFSYRWRSGPTCSTNLWEAEETEAQMNCTPAERCLHTLLIWATGSVPDARALLPMWARAKWRGWWIQLHDDAMIRNHTWHVSTWELPCRGGWGRAQQVFFFTFKSCRRAAAAYFYAARRSATDLTLDKWRWQERIICSNITSASCASTTALLSLKSGAKHTQPGGWVTLCVTQSLHFNSDEKQGKMLHLFSFFFFNFQACFFVVAVVVVLGMVWSIHFHPQSPIVFMY